jgi:hypothetical protein
MLMGTQALDKLSSYCECVFSNEPDTVVMWSLRCPALSALLNLLDSTRLVWCCLVGFSELGLAFASVQWDMLCACCSSSSKYLRWLIKDDNKSRV